MVQKKAAQSLVLHNFATVHQRITIMCSLKCSKIIVYQSTQIVS